MSIETLADWNERIGAGCGCCRMPECPVPAQECESILAIAESRIGNSNPSDSVFTRYSYKEEVETWTVDASVGSTETQTSEATYKSITEWGDPLFDWAIYFCAGGESLTPIPSCESTGSLTVNGYDGAVDVANLYGSETTTREYIGGTETEEHIYWRSLYPTDLDYQAAVDAYDQYVIDEAAYQQYLDDYAAWEAGGSIGDPPEVVGEPAVVEEPLAEPLELYPDCSWKDTNTYQAYDSGTPSGDPVVSYWYAFGTDFVPLSAYGSRLAGVDADIVYTTSYDGAVYYADMVAAMREKMLVGTDILDERPECRGELCYSNYDVSPEDGNNDIEVRMTRGRYRWVIPVVGTMNDPEAELPEAPDPLPEGQTQQEWENEWWADHQVDVRWRGSYFKITWNVIEEPEGWDKTINDPDAELPDPPDPLPDGQTLEEWEDQWWSEHQVPDPAAPARSFIPNPDALIGEDANEWVWEWTGPGTGNADDPSWKSSWYDLEPPEVSGTRRVVNIRFECYRSPQYGNKPQTTGEGVDLPLPEP